MKKRRSATVKLVYAAVCLALALVLPFLTGQIPQIGNMLCPMHFPVFICGFLCGWPWGAVVGLCAPLLRSAIFGMPPMFPTAVSMAFELAVYGLVAGLLYQKLPRKASCVYLSLIGAMVAGRLVWGAVRFVLAGLTDSTFPFSAFLSGALTTAIPGIVLQILLIPPIILAVDRERKKITP
ncbi:MAG: ECF transporter S component [Oscillospiraceae bacterium]